MLTMPQTASPRPRSYLLSFALHAACLGALIGVVSVRPPRVVPNKLPGTALGNTMLVYYSPGGPPRAAAIKPAVPKPSTVPSHAPALSAPREKAPPAELSADKGSGHMTESGLGEGDLRIALPSYFPTPSPSLTTMAAGTAGDVILDAVIDEHGHVTQLTVLKGLTPAIDQQVIATVQQWTYTPATRDGTPVPSGQELHFHFEKGSAA